MSIEAMVIALHHSRSQGTARNVLIGIANHAGDGGAWPTNRTLRKYAGWVTERNVRKAVAHLVELGEISVSIQAGGGPRVLRGRRPNRYDILLTCPPWCDGSMQHRDRREQDPDLWTPVAGDPRTPVAGDPRTPVAGDPRTPVAGDPLTVLRTVPEPSGELSDSGRAIHSSHGEYPADPDQFDIYDVPGVMNE